MKPMVLVVGILFLLFINIIALVSAIRGGPHFQRSVAVIVFSIVIVAVIGLFLFSKAFRK
jgi:hypothetical protein